MELHKNVIGNFFSVLFVLGDGECASVDEIVMCFVKCVEGGRCHG